MIDVREKAAKQFSARLTGRGFESWVREVNDTYVVGGQEYMPCLLYTSPSPRD